MIKQGHPVKIVEKNGYPVIIQNIEDLENGGGGTTEPYELPREYQDFQNISSITITGIDITTVPYDLTLLASINENFQGDSLIKYDRFSKTLKADPDTTLFYNFDFVFRMSGTFQSNDEGIEVYIARPNGEKITGVTYVKGFKEDANKVDFQLPIIKTFVGSGGDDRFQTEGFKIFIRAIENKVTLSGSQKLIFSN